MKRLMLIIAKPSIMQHTSSARATLDALSTVQEEAGGGSDEWSSGDESDECDVEVEVDRTTSTSGGSVAEPSTWSASRGPVAVDRAPSTKDKGELMADLDAKLRRLSRFANFISGVTCFDDEDREAVLTEIEDTSTMLIELTASLGRDELPLVNMRRTLKNREMLIEEAVASERLRATEDGTFLFMVKKQANLLKIVDRSSTS